jgi:hypothetical protein
MHQIETKIEELQELTPNPIKKEPLYITYAPRKICQLSSKSPTMNTNEEGILFI